MFPVSAVAFSSISLDLLYEKICLASYRLRVLNEKGKDCKRIHALLYLTLNAIT